MVQRAVFRLRGAGAGQAVPAAAGLLRPAAARRDPQPGHQRHRQPPAVHAADPEPAGDVAADHRRRADADVRRLLGAGADRAGHRAGVGVRDAQDRQAGAAAVHQPVEVHRQAQRPHRGDVHRARAGHGVRPAGGGDGDLHRAERGPVPRQLPGPVHLRHHPAGDDVRLEPQLRAGRRRRRTADRGRFADARRGDRVHPVLAAVQPAADPGRQHGQPAAVQRGLGRAGVRAAGRAPSRRRTRPSPPGRPRSGAGWSSRTCRSGTCRTGR